MAEARERLEALRSPAPDGRVLVGGRWYAPEHAPAAEQTTGKPVSAAGGRKDDGGKPRLDLFPYDLVMAAFDEAADLAPPDDWRRVVCAWWRRERDDTALFAVLVSAGGLEEIAARVVPVLEHGVAKYGAWNWWKGMAWSRVFAAWLRHKWQDGVDADTGLPHADHALCCLMFLCCYALAGRGEDDRPG